VEAADQGVQGSINTLPHFSAATNRWLGLHVGAGVNRSKDAADPPAACLHT